MIKKCFRTLIFIFWLVAFGSFFIPSESDGKSTWKVQSQFTENLPFIWPHTQKAVNRISSETSIKIKLYRAGALSSPGQILEYVGDGTIDGGITTPVYWSGKNEAFQAFTGSTSIRSVRDFYSWLREGSGRSFYDTLYGQYGVKAIPCTIMGPEGFWSRKSIQSLKDLSGFKARSSGSSPSKVMKKLGMKIIRMPNSEIYMAGERGVIEGAEFGPPYIDIQSKFYQLWKYYYYPSFHSPFMVVNFLINLKKWNSLPSSQRQTIKRICHESVLRSLAEDERLAKSTISDLKRKGVAVREFSPEIWSAAKAAWREVEAELSRNSNSFASIYDAYKEYDTSKEAGTIIVKTNLKGAKFEISGTKIFRGRGEYWSRAGVPAGTYEISYEKVENNDPPMASKKVLKGGAQVIFEGYYKKKTGSIAILSNPSGATIYLDEKYNSKTPNEIKGLSPGRHEIVLRKAGYGVWKEAIHVKAGRKLPISAELKAEDSTPPSITLENPQIEAGKPLKVTDSVLTVKGKVTDTGGVFEVIVNDTPARVSEGGRFTSQKIKLKFGENNISIRAADLSDNVKKMSFIVIRSSIIEKGEPLPKMVKRWFGKSRSWAVVIGIDDYPSESGFDRLPYAVRDAKAVEDYLIKNLGFSKNRVKRLYNKDATKKNFLQILGDELPGEVTEEARVLIFFSGHGATRKIGHSQIGYLVPIDGNKKSLHATCIPMTEIQTISRQFIAKQMLFIVDACYSGLAGRIIKSGTLDANTREQVEGFIKGGGRHIMTAGTSEETAQMSDIWNRHSVYTYHLLRGLEGDADFNLDEVVTVYELHNYLLAKVPQEANQHPQLRPLGQSEGQFVFYREGALD